MLVDKITRRRAKELTIPSGLWQHSAMIEVDPHSELAAAEAFISVVIPHYNDLENLARCHDRLLRQTWPRSKFEIVVADNNSRCGLGAVQLAAPQAIVVPAEIQGAGPARNAGVAASRGDILAFLDSDCVPEPDWLENGVAALTRFDFVGGEVVVFPQNPKRPNPVEAFEMVFTFNFRRYIEEVGFTGTGNMFVWRHVFERVGGFRAGVSEDVDWSMRARQSGFRLGYAQHAKVGHPARADWAELKKRWIRMLRETYLLVCERPFGRAGFVLRAVLMPISIIPHAAKVLRSDRLGDARARLGAIQILVRLRLWRTAEMLRLGMGPA